MKNQMQFEEALQSFGASRFYAFPREVLFIITDQLPIWSQISLALTNKFFFTSLYPTRQFPRLSDEDFIALFVLLEKDLQNRYLCFGCKKLRYFNPSNGHDWKAQPHPVCGANSESGYVQIQHDFPWYTNSETANLNIRRDSTDHSLHIWIETPNLLLWRPFPYPSGPKSKKPNNGWPEITFSQARLVMNRHIFGKPHGLSIQCLHQRFEFERFIFLDDRTTPTHFPIERHARHAQNRPITRSLSKKSAKPWNFIHEYSAKILNGELLVSRSHFISGPHCSAAHFSKLIDSLELPVCAHIFAAAIRPNSGFYHDANASIPQLHALWVAGHDTQLDVYTDNGGGACQTCYTDYSIKIWNGERDKHWALNLVTYHNLGRCQNPNDPIWHCLTKSSYSRFRWTELSRPLVRGINVSLRWEGKEIQEPPLESEDFGPFLEYWMDQHERWIEPYEHMISHSFGHSPEYQRLSQLAATDRLEDF